MLAVEARTKWELMVGVHSWKALWAFYSAVGFRIKKAFPVDVLSRGDTHPVISPRSQGDKRSPPSLHPINEGHIKMVTPTFPLALMIFQVLLRVDPDDRNRFTRLYYRLQTE